MASSIVFRLLVKIWRVARIYLSATPLRRWQGSNRMLSSELSLIKIDRQCLKKIFSSTLLSYSNHIVLTRQGTWSWSDLHFLSCKFNVFPIHKSQYFSSLNALHLGKRKHNIATSVFRIALERSLSLFNSMPETEHSEVNCHKLINNPSLEGFK